MTHPLAALFAVTLLGASAAAQPALDGVTTTCLDALLARRRRASANPTLRRRDPPR